MRVGLFLVEYCYGSPLETRLLILLVRWSSTINGDMLSVVNKRSTPMNNINAWTSAFLIFASVIFREMTKERIRVIKIPAD